VALRELGYRVTAIDYSWAMIARAQRSSQTLQLVQMDAAQLAFRDASFDHALFSFNGLDYIYPYSRRIQTFLEIRRVLRPGGWLIYSSHNTTCHLCGFFRVGIVLKNWLAGNRFFFSRYRIDFQPYGRLLTCYTNPIRERRLLRKLGFAPIHVHTDRADGWRHLRAILTSAWLYYAARRQEPLRSSSSARG
jgi:SAM-dependent methyltransferase